MRRVTARGRYSEEAVAIETCYHLYRQGWVPYPELGGWADIIAHNPVTDEIIAVEVKAQANLKVVEQADSSKTWRHCNGAYIAFPTGVGYGRYITMLCKELGIGVITPTMPYRGRCEEFTVTPARARRRSGGAIDRDIRPLMIKEAQFYTTPGRKSPRQFTNFRLRELTLLRILEKTPGLTYKELAQAEAELDGRKKHTARAPTYLRELCERKAFDHFEHDPETGKVWPKFAWGSKEAGHSPMNYDGLTLGSHPNTLSPVAEGTPIETLHQDEAWFRLHGDRT